MKRRKRPAWLTMPEAADTLGVCEATARKLLAGRPGVIDVSTGMRRHWRAAAIVVKALQAERSAGLDRSQH